MESITESIDTVTNNSARIKVIGVGGGGGNAVQKMISSNLTGIQFLCANTDMQALCNVNAPVKIQLGEKLTRGLGAGANPEVGKNAAIESTNAIREALGEQPDLVFITAGMGGGTGTGAAPVIAQIAKDMNALTIGVVTKPFSFEGSKKQKVAEAGIMEFKKYVDSLIIIPNDRLQSLAQKGASIASMLDKANEVLLNAVQGISDVITKGGLINVDFADVRTTMQQMGLAIMGIGRASGENRAREATHQAIVSPLIEDASLESAKAILYNVTASSDLGMAEITEIGNMIKEAAKEDINIIFGIVSNEEMGDELQVTVIATGIEPQVEDDIVPPAESTVIPFDQSKKDTGFKPPFIKPKPVEQPRNLNQNVEPATRNPRRMPQDFYYEDLNMPKSTYAQYGNYGNRNRPHIPGQDEFIYNEEELEIPTFIRKLAD